MNTFSCRAATLAPLLLVVFARADAANADEATKGPDAEYYPTAMGTQWVMKWTYFDGTGDPTIDDVRVVDEKVVNGYRKWKVRVETRDAAKNLLEAFARAIQPPAEEDVSEFWEYYDVGKEAYVSLSLDEEAEPPLVLLYHPSKVQDVFRDEEDGTVTTVIAEGRVVDVPAGRFECDVFEIDYSGDGTEVIAVEDAGGAADGAAEDEPGADEEYVETSVIVEYWSPGVGLVMSEDYVIEDDGSRTLTARQVLVSYEVPQPAGGAPESENAKDE